MAGDLHGRRLIRASNGLLFLAAILIVIGAILGRINAATIIGVLLLIVAIVLTVVHRVQRSKRMKGS